MLPETNTVVFQDGQRAGFDVVSFFLVGIEPIQIQISRRTILINALATPWLLTSTL
jgi:hypothetical protein